MPVGPKDIDKLIELLGSRGALAGLEESPTTAAELYSIAEERGLRLDKKSSRHDLVCDIINSNHRLITETLDELTDLSRSELERLVVERNVSATEIRSVLSQFEIEPRKLTRSKLIDFFANEVADLGMYQRVSKGRAGARQS